MTTQKLLAESYNHCRRLTASAARNFYFGILLLPKPKRDALCAIYAFMRHSDDLSDDPEVANRKEALIQWRRQLECALSADEKAFSEAAESNLILPAFRDAVQQYNIPDRYFHELIDGTEMDVSRSTYETFDDLYRYCYRVASTVGLTCIHVFGFSDERAKQYAEWNGIAFQLTNILRDIREDADRGRVYLPVEDLRKFGFADAQTFLREGAQRGPRDSRFAELMRFEAQRARDYYEKAQPLIGLIDRDSRAALWAMTMIYRGILERIVLSGFDVINRRISLPLRHKLSLFARAWLRRGRDDWTLASGPGLLRT